MGVGTPSVGLLVSDGERIFERLNRVAVLCLSLYGRHTVL